MPATRWSAHELVRLRQLAAEGLPAATISQRLERTTSAVLTALSRHGLTLPQHAEAVRERILELVAAGWSVSRISRQHGLNPIAIRRLLAQEVVAEPTVAARPTGRLVAKGEAA